MSAVYIEGESRVSITHYRGLNVEPERSRLWDCAMLLDHEPIP